MNFAFAGFRRDDNFLDVRPHDLPGLEVPAAVHRLGEHGDPLACPLADFLLIGPAGLQADVAQLGFQVFAPSAKLRELAVEQRQVGRVEVFGQRGDRLVEFPDITFEPLGLGLGGRAAGDRRHKLLHRRIEAARVGKDQSAHRLQRELLQWVGLHVQRRGAGALAVSPATGTDVVLGDDGAAALLLGLAPEAAAAAATVKHARQQPEPGLLAKPADHLAAPHDHHLCPVPILARDDGGQHIADDDPVLLRQDARLARVVTLLHLVHTAAFNGVELALGATVPNQVAAIGRVLDDGLDCGVRPEIAAWRRQATRVEPVGDAEEAHAIEAPGENVAHRLHPLGLGEHHPAFAVLAGLAERLALAIHGRDVAVLVQHLPHPPREVPHAVEQRPVRPDDLAVVAIRARAAGVGLRLHRRDLPSQRVLRQRDGELPVLELLHGAQNVAVEAFAVQVIFSHRQHRHARLTEQVAIMLGLGDIAA